MWKVKTMLVRDCMTRAVVFCTPWDTARTAARLMTAHNVGALPVVSSTADPLLEGIVTDRDLCRGVVAGGKNSDSAKIADLLTLVPVTCEPENTLVDCEKLMQSNQVRRIPVVDKRGRCVGIVSQADVALHAPALEVARMLSEISSPAKPSRNLRFDPDLFYCGQLHEQDQILLLKRRRELCQEVEVAP